VYGNNAPTGLAGLVHVQAGATEIDAQAVTMIRNAGRATALEKLDEFGHPPGSRQ